MSGAMDVPTVAKRYSLMNPLGSVWSASWFDAANRLVASTNPLARTLTTVFDAAANR